MGEFKKLFENGFKKNDVTFESIVNDIKIHQGHGTESNPEQYGQIFFDILRLSDVPKNDLLRYSKYVISYLQGEIEKYVKDDGD